MEPRCEPVARCPHCVELNVLSANYCKHCGHEAHGKKADCRCRRCTPPVLSDGHPGGFPSDSLIEALYRAPSAPPRDIDGDTWGQQAASG